MTGRSKSEARGLPRVGVAIVASRHPHSLACTAESRRAIADYEFQSLLARYRETGWRVIDAPTQEWRRSGDFWSLTTTLRVVPCPRRRNVWT